MTTRRGVVLGSGGILGLAWMTGALRAIEDHGGFDVREVDVLVGTSAGSLLAVLLGAGVSTYDVLAHQNGGVVRAGPLAGLDISPDTLVDSRLRPPKPGVGSGRLLLRHLQRRTGVTPSAFLAGLVPAGRGSLDQLAALVDTVAPDWPGAPDLEIVAMDFDTGERAVFGNSSPHKGAAHVPATPATGVTASCSIPGWFAPVVAGDRRFIDGGSASVVSADLLVERELDEAYVLAPMASAPATRSWQAWLVRRWRQHQIAQTKEEVELLRAHGTKVVLLAPGAEDLEAAGLNLMDPARRHAVLETSLRTSRRAVANFFASPTGSGGPS